MGAGPPGIPKATSPAREVHSRSTPESVLTPGKNLEEIFCAEPDCEIPPGQTRSHTPNLCPRPLLVCRDAVATAGKASGQGRLPVEPVSGSGLGTGADRLKVVGESPADARSNPLYGRRSPRMPATTCAIPPGLWVDRPSYLPGHRTDSRSTVLPHPGLKSAHVHSRRGRVGSAHHCPAGSANLHSKEGAGGFFAYFAFFATQFGLSSKFSSVGFTHKGRRSRTQPG
jgi:hypothetical protein